MQPLWIPVIYAVLIVMFSLSASFKFLRTRSMVRHWTEYRYPVWGMYGIAALEAVGVAILISAFWMPSNATYAAVLFAVLMVGAIHAHLFRAKHKPAMAVNAVLMLVLSVILLIT
ncbi:DoxX family protein [Paenibacillus sp. GYB003]|uniref:DoxX family protein n=1 Tax=Paenibacillus sp. GYB003 TaxID=2994392 RepID=UPI002F96444E